MANVLGELFGEIASAIRSKTGDDGTMKPAEFPEKITAISSVSGADEFNALLDEINGEVISGKVVTFIGVDGSVLCKVSVVPGKTCPNPVTTGLIAKPTKEPSASTVYTFSGWSLTMGGVASSDALSNVTEDRTVYVAFTTSSRMYTVKFYDGNTLLKTVSVGYGASATYTPPKKENYMFTGWEPSANKITSDTNCYAQWKLSDKLVDYTWPQISAMSESGEAPSKFQVGDTKGFDMTIGNKTYALTAKLIGFNHDDLADGTGKAGMTFEIIDIAKTPQESKTGHYYPTSNAWKTFAQYAQDYVESDLSQHIKQVTKTCYDNDNHVYGTLNAYMWAISMRELGFKITSKVPDDGSPYEYYADNERIASTDYAEQEKNKYPELLRYDENNFFATGGACNWKTRSTVAVQTGSRGFWAIHYKGYAWHFLTFTETLSESLCFCL